MAMKNILLTLAATAALMVGGMTFTDSADARPRGWGRYGGYSTRYYRPSYGYGYRTYPRYNYGYRSYGYPGYYRSYRYPGYYGGGYYGGYYPYRSGVYLSTPGVGVYFR
jgi:hypothetical protein